MFRLRSFHFLSQTLVHIFNHYILIRKGTHLRIKVSNSWLQLEHDCIFLFYLLLVFSSQVFNVRFAIEEFMGGVHCLMEIQFPLHSALKLNSQLSNFLVFLIAFCLKGFNFGL
jgi:hypothetical protein